MSTVDKIATVAVLTLLLSGCPASPNYRDCDEARQASAAPLHRDDPGYSRVLDRDGDGIACERGGE